MSPPKQLLVASHTARCGKVEDTGPAWPALATPTPFLTQDLGEQGLGVLCFLMQTTPWPAALSHGHGPGRARQAGWPEGGPGSLYQHLGEDASPSPHLRPSPWEGPPTPQGIQIPPHVAASPMPSCPDNLVGPSQSSRESLWQVSRDSPVPRMTNLGAQARNLRV